MLSENTTELTTCGILDWQKKGYKGKGITVAVLDGDNFEHYGAVEQVILEVAPEVTIKYFDYLHGGNQDEIVDWILTNKPDVVNCSFGGAFPDKTFEKLKDSGIILVCASGNDSRKDSRYPAKYDWTISVGAFEQNGDKLAYYSDGAPNLDCVGYTDIRVKVGENVYTFDGTSCASPFVAGMISIYLGYLKQNGFRKPTVDEVKQLIHSNCIDKLEKGIDIMSGYGLFVLPNEFTGVKDVSTQPTQPTEPAKPPVNNTTTANTTFSDVATDRWSYSDIQKVAKAGYMSGLGGGKFGPDQPLTREQMAALLVRILKL